MEDTIARHIKSVVMGAVLEKLDADLMDNASLCIRPPFPDGIDIADPKHVNRVCKQWATEQMKGFGEKFIARSSFPALFQSNPDEN